MRTSSIAALVACVGLALAASGVRAQTVLINSNIAISQVWTADKTYDLQGQIFVLPGASLTIEAGTVVASTTGMGGSIAVTKGAQIFIEGTVDAPVIMTSTSDVATWAVDPGHPTGRDPSTGVWREAANEWGNLTIMGSGFISENATAANVNTCNANNVAPMEGLVTNPMAPTLTQYGGGNDNDDSGSISYLSIRYGGNVIALNDELNGLSLGGIGRETDIHHVEIMNNVDDGIEIWGGTVNLKYISIWNIGDDSFDVDQGWRGKAQFVLLVQGWSLDTNQGGGVGDNCFEVDGAENSDWQPVTTTTIYNATVIGQPVDGDHGMAFRDNARVQYRNCVFMNIGDDVVRFDNQDGDGAQGYGFNGTLSWPATWTTAYNAVPARPNDCPPGTYPVQTSGNLCEVKDSVFFGSNDYTEAIARGVFNAANDNVMEPALSPITTLTRGPQVVRGGLIMQQVTFLDPRPANDALAFVAQAPASDSFWSSAPYRGAFAPGVNWLANWTASEAFGFTPSSYVSPAPAAGQPGNATAAALDINDARNAAGAFVDAGTPGPHFSTIVQACDPTVRLTISGQPNQPVIMLASTTLNPGASVLPGGIGAVDIGSAGFGGVVIVAAGTDPGFLNSLFNTGPTGTVTISGPSTVFPPGTVLTFQGVVFNTATVVRMTNAVRTTII